MKSPKLRVLPAREKNTGELLRTQPPAFDCRQSCVKLSAEAGPVAHKPLFRVQVSPFLPGGSPVQLRGAIATSGCARLRCFGAIDINPGQTPGGCLSTAAVLRYCGGGPERGWRMLGGNMRIENYPLIKSILRLITGLGLLVILLTQLLACALIPDAVPIKIQHVSHISQHFREHPTNLGYTGVYAGLKWKRGNFSIELDEGWTREPLDGMHEVTQASIEYDIPLHR